MKRTILYIFIVFSIVFLSKTKLEAQNGFGLSFHTSFNHEDIFWGFDMGLLNAKKSSYGFIAFDFRGFKKKILIQDPGGAWFQFAERRFLVSSGYELRKMINDSNVGYFIQLRGGYTWGDYAGAKRKPDKGFTLIPRAGLLYKINIIKLKLGYEFFNPKNNAISPHRAYFTISFS